MARQKRRIDVRILRSGKVLRASEREALALVRGGVAEYVNDADNPKYVAQEELAAMRERQAPAAPAPAPPVEESDGSDDLEGMAYNALRTLAAERGVSPGGRKKDDYIAALRAGRYNRRDMQAEE